MDTKQENVERAKLAEQAERYDDMVTAMKAVVTITEGDLKDEERNLLSVAYKNVVGARRSAWRILKSLEEKEEKAKDEIKRDLARISRENVEKELNEKCREVLHLIDKHLYPKAKDSNGSSEAIVFYLKMKGDYYRYLVEIYHNEESGEKSEEFKESKKAYEEAENECENLPPTHPIKLGLALNFSVFYYEIEEKPEEACIKAEKAYDDAMKDLTLKKNEDEMATYKDSTLIMQLLRDNLTLWKQEAQDREADEDCEGD